MMRRTLFCLSLATTLGTGCASMVEQPSESAALQSGIVGGQAEHAYPAVGALMDGQGLCTGTIFQGRWVVSAAHCFADNAQGFQFYLGDDVNAPSRVIPVAQIFSHPQYDAQNMLNDIALVELAEDPGVEGVPLLQAMDAGAVGRSMKFVGFGITGGGLQDSGTKRSVDIAVSAVDATTFRYDDPAHNTCNGDSGGPAFVTIGGTEYIAGVTSWGDEPCREFGVDTRVDAFAAFIQQAMAGQVPQGGGPAPNGQDPQGQDPNGQDPGLAPDGQNPQGQAPDAQDPQARTRTPRTRRRRLPRRGLRRLV
jgi:secreted trypsin-like serine protease